MDEKSDAGVTKSANITKPQYRLFNNLLDGVIVEDSTGHVEYFNKAAAKICGVDHVDLHEQRKLRHYLNENFTPLGESETPAAVAFRNGLAQVNKLIGVAKGTDPIRWILVNAVPLEPEHPGDSRLVMSTIRDVTDERNTRVNFEKIQEQRQQREEFFSGTLDRLPCLVAYVTPDLNYEYVNGTFERWQGAPAESIQGKSVLEVSGPVIFAAIEGKLRRALAGEIVRFVTHIPNHPHGIYHSQLHYYPDFNELGSVRGIYCVIEDITQVKLAEAALKQSERLSQMLDSLPSAISYWNLSCINIHTNLAYAKSWDRTIDEVTGIDMKELIGKEFFEQDRPFREMVFGGQSANFERQVPTADGGVKIFLITLLPDKKGSEVVGFFVMSNDITDLRLAESEKREMEVKLVAASKMSSLGEMAGGVAHEINNPLAIISGRASMIENLLEAEAPDLVRVRGELARINLTVERIAKIIRGLRAFARNADSDAPSLCSLKVILTDTIELCQERMKTLGVEFSFLFPDDVNIECRPAQISQVIMNLIGNSIDAIEHLSSKWIRLNVDIHDARVTITVTDSGTGIQDEVIDKMMNPFFTTKEIGKGTGLGLSISKGLAEKNNAQLSYVKGPNTQFIFEISRSVKKPLLTAA